MFWNSDGLTIYLGNETFHLFPLTIAVFLTTLAVLCLGVFFLLRRQRKTTTGLQCNWRRLLANDRPPFTQWQCLTCGVDAYSTSKRRPPKECKRELKTSI